jgi:hypothetical protein
VLKFEDRGGEVESVGLEGESKEASSLASKAFGDVGSNSLAAFPSARTAEAVVARGAGDAVDVGVIEGVIDVGTVATVSESLEPGG